MRAVPFTWSDTGKHWRLLSRGVGPDVRVLAITLADVLGTDWEGVSIDTGRLLRWLL